MHFSHKQSLKRFCNATLCFSESFTEIQWHFVISSAQQENHCPHDAHFFCFTIGLKNESNAADFRDKSGKRFLQFRNLQENEKWDHRNKTYGILRFLHRDLHFLANPSKKKHPIPFRKKRGRVWHHRCKLQLL
jgi:hypothetical protein